MPKATEHVELSCKYPSCRSIQYSKVSPNYEEKRFFRFPEDPERLVIWKEICGISSTSDECRDYRLCEDHFVLSDYKDNNDPHFLSFSAIPKSSTQVQIQNEHFYTDKQIEVSITDELLTDPNNEQSQHDEEGNISDSEMMQNIHKDVISELSKLQSILANNVSKLKEEFDHGTFQLMHDNLNMVTDDFIAKELKNYKYAPTDRSWSVADKTVALSIFKTSPRLYQYLRMFCQLPTVAVLQTILKSLSFDCGILIPGLKQKIRTGEMYGIDSFCVLSFDQMNLTREFSYDDVNDKIIGFQDLGQLGRTSDIADHALLFMIQGIHKKVKFPVAYFFFEDLVKSSDLKQLIIHVIKELQKIGIKVCATVCKPNLMNTSALKSLIQDCKNDDGVTFTVDRNPIVVIYDVPNLLINTRNALLEHKLEYEKGKFASMNHIKQAFLLGNKQTYKLILLNENDFNFDDISTKRKVYVAVRQLHNKVAATIETYQTKLGSDSMETAQFCHDVGVLFDSLNGSQFDHCDGMEYRSALSKGSPHIKLWSEMLPKISNWKIFENGEYKYNSELVEGWQTTIKSVMTLWKYLHSKGLPFLNLRCLNLEPLKHIFHQLRQYSYDDFEPSCTQFIEALKTVVIYDLCFPDSEEDGFVEEFCEKCRNESTST